MRMARTGADTRSVKSDSSPVGSSSGRSRLVHSASSVMCRRLCGKGASCWSTSDTYTSLPV
jgi:hypothetical protein